MSRENVEAIKRGYEAFAEGNLDAIFELLDPTVVIADEESFPEEGDFHGHEGFIDVVARQMEVWDNWSLKVERVIDLDEEDVLVLHRQCGTAKASGIYLEQPMGHVWTLRNRRVVRLVTYGSYEEALEALRLRE